MQGRIHLEFVRLEFDREDGNRDEENVSTVTNLWPVKGQREAYLGQKRKGIRKSTCKFTVKGLVPVSPLP